MLYFLGSPTRALNAYERRLRPWDHQKKWCSSDRKGTSILKGIWYSPAIPLLYDTILIYIWYSSSSIISKDQRGEVDVMFGLVRFLLFHRFSNMQHQSWLDLAKIFVAEKWDSRRMTFLPAKWEASQWISSGILGSLVTGFHGSLKAMAVVWKVFFFMCSKWGLDHLRLWSLVLGPLNSFCASEAVATQLTKDEDKHHKRDTWFSMKQWPLELNASNKVPSIKQFEDQMVSGKVAEDMRIVCSFQELQCLEQMERLVLPSGVLQTREPLRCLRFCVCVCVHVQISPSKCQ